MTLSRLLLAKMSVGSARLLSESFTASK